MNGGGAEREGDTEFRSRLQALSHQPRARRGAQTHGPRDGDLAEVGRLTDCATQAPHKGQVLKHVASHLIGGFFSAQLQDLLFALKL